MAITQKPTHQKSCFETKRFREKKCFVVSQELKFNLYSINKQPPKMASTSTAMPNALLMRLQERLKTRTEYSHVDEIPTASGIGDTHFVPAMVVGIALNINAMTCLACCGSATRDRPLLCRCS
jgi:hypothetical protein